MEKRLILADDLYRFKSIKSCELSLDGRHVVFSLHRVDRVTEKKYSNLWVAPTDKSGAFQFSSGDQADHSPQWSPDGSTIAFLSNRKDEKQFQLYTIFFNGGEATCATHLKGEFETFSWSPDGSTIIFQFRKTDPETVEREENEDKKKLGVVSRHIKRIFYKLDGLGYLPEERWHLWELEIKTGKTRQLTDSPIFDETDPAWSPDGQKIAYLSNHNPDPDLNPNDTRLYGLDVQTLQSEEIPTPTGPKQFPVYSPDGEWIAYLGKEGLGKRGLFGFDGLG